jgi:Xaa-Pro dipeptidase
MSLTRAGCEARQRRFLGALEARGVAAAVITAPRDIHYLTGVLPELPIHPYPSVLFLGPGLDSWLLTGLGEGDPLVDERVVYPINLLYTLNPDNHRRAGAVLADLIRRSQGLTTLGFQRESLPHSLAAVITAAAAPRAWVEIDEVLQDQQLRKDPDEIDCIRRAVQATLAGYDRARALIAPGVSELEVMTEAQAAAQRFSGQVHYFNGDFQSGQFGGFARPRPIEAGELYIIDAWSDLGGYWCDMARTFAVSRPTDLQESVYQHIAGILRAVPEMARPGRDTSDMWRELDSRVREHPFLADLGMKDHGGHGVGSRVHEMPDLNRDRGGVFAVGNVFTCEPAVYHPDLNLGVRLEDVFVLREGGAEPLVPYPLQLAETA